jgi:cell volume regulation protein A
LGFSLLEGFLLGAVISSTDAAAVFSILRARSISLKKRLKPLLEFESGSNDPMAVFMTLGLISIIESAEFNGLHLLIFFVKQMALGALVGYVMSRVMIATMNRLDLEYEGLYSVLSLSLVLFTYALASYFQGNGFLAVYIAGLLMSKEGFFYKKNLLHFHDGLAWLMQIAMFLTLGLLVFPSQLIPVIIPGILVSVFLMFVARPLSVYLCFLPFHFSIREKAMISWVGLRGAAPIILATFVLMADTAQAGTIFNIVFFVVITSVLLQGTTLPYIAKWLKVDAPLQKRPVAPIEFEPRKGVDAELLELIVPYHGEVSGKAIYEVNLPADCLVTLVCRDDKFIMANGKTVLEEGDVVLVLVNQGNMAKVQSIFNRVKEPPPPPPKN